MPVLVSPSDTFLMHSNSATFENSLRTCRCGLRMVYTDLLVSAFRLDNQDTNLSFRLQQFISVGLYEKHVKCIAS